MNVNIKKLGDCVRGDVVQFLSEDGYRRKLKSDMNISIDEYTSAKQGRTKGIVISKTKNKSKVLEFDSIGSNSFNGLLILSSMRNSFLVCKLNPKMTFDPHPAIKGEVAV